jgi:hypothetical protein
LQNVARALGPDEWLGFFVVMSDVLVDSFDQLGHAGEHASAQTLTTPSRSTATCRRCCYYDIATNTWTQSGSKVYNDRSDEESWVRLPDGRVMTYTFVSWFQLQ